MDSAFDPAEHKEFSDYIIANKKHFDQIEAQYMDSKASGNQSGIIIAPFFGFFIYHYLYLQLCLLVRSLRWI